MGKYEVSMIILERLFDFSSLIVYGGDKTEALKEAIEEMISRLQSMSEHEIKQIAEDSDDLIYAPIIMRIDKKQKE